MNELPPNLAALLDRARTDHDPSEVDRERVLSALTTTLALGGAATVLSQAPAAGAQMAGAQMASTTTGVPAAVAGTAGLAKWGVIAVLAAGVGTWSVWPAAKEGAHERAPSVAAASHEQARIPAPSPALPGPDRTVAPPAVEHPVNEMATHETADAPAVAASTRPAPSVASPVARPRERAQVTPNVRAPASREDRMRQVVSAPTAGSTEEPVSNTTAARNAPASASDVSAPPVAPSSQEELKLIRAALTALRDGHPDDALDALAEHARNFPRGALASQRAGLRVVALCDAGQRAQGVREQQAFLANDDSSALAQRVRQACTSEPAR